MDIFEKNNWVIRIWEKLKGFIKPLYYNGFDGSSENKHHRGFNKNVSNLIKIKIWQATLERQYPRNPMNNTNLVGW